MAAAVEIDLRVPQIRSPETAIRVFYTQPQLGKKDAMAIFGCSESTWYRLKRAALALMRERNVPQWNDRMVSTATAFEAWGVDVPKIEKGLERVRRLLG